MLPTSNIGVKPRTFVPIETMPVQPPRDRILAAADDLFRRVGIRGVGVEAIAAAADTNKMTLYRHFESKVALIAEWVRGIIAEKEQSWSELRRRIRATRRRNSLTGCSRDARRVGGSWLGAAQCAGGAARTGSSGAARDRRVPPAGAP
jgi:AcrR family transcriptional regulator